MTLSLAILWSLWANTMTGPDCRERGVACGVNVCQTHGFDIDGNGCLDLLDLADWLISLPPAESL